MMETGMSPADVVALSGNDGFGGSNSWFWIVVLFLFGWGGYGGNRDNYATQTQLQSGFEAQNTYNKLEALGTAQAGNALDNANLINANKYDNAILIKDAQYTNLQNTNALAASLNQNADSIVLGLTNGFNSLTAGINDIGYQIQSTACATNRNIDSVKFENAQNTCAITNAIHQEAEATRAMIQQNTIQDLRDRLEDKDRLYQAANFQISQNAQTANLLDSLGRWVSNPPMPIYAAPYYGYGTTYGVIS